MKIRLLLSCLLLFLFSYLTNAQSKQLEPTLRARLQKYAADNHLYLGGTYIYFDTVTKKPYRFSPESGSVEDVSQPPSAPSVVPSLPNTTNNVLGGGNFHLVKDINNFTDANPANYYYLGVPNLQRFAVLNKVAYFSAKDDSHGNELWRSDGTATGTYLVKDIVAGEASSSVENIIVSGNELFFIIYSTTDGKNQLWKSDGTEAGTLPVSDTANSIQYPEQLCDVNGTVYFVTTHNQRNSQLWKTNGTETGTVLVKDFSDEGQYYVLNDLVSAHNLLIFTAYRTAIGTELWRSDGTDTGTFLVKDIDPSPYQISGPSQLTAYNNKLYFSESDGKSYKLFASDGTTAGTDSTSGKNDVAIENFSSEDGYNIPFTVSNNTLYFTGFAGEALYKYNDSSSVGIELVSNITNIDPQNITDVNGTVYFYNTDQIGKHLYKTNGTDNSTFLIKDFAAYSLSKLVNGNGKLYFVSSDPVNGAEPWISDGTETGTLLLKDIYPGTISSNPSYFTALNSSVLFAATDSLIGTEIWTSDGNKAQLVTEINKTATSDSYPHDIVPFNNNVIFSASSYNQPNNPWLSDGNTASLIKSFTSLNQYNYLIKDSLAYFICGSNADNICKTNGTTEGTTQIVLGASGIVNSYAVTDNGTIFYFLQSFSDFYGELWKTDGTAQGNVLLQKFSTIPFDLNIIGLTGGITILGNSIYFAASPTSSRSDVELWKSDGTVAGTVVVKDINPGSNGSNPALKTLFNNQIYFQANDGTETALWKSDGTTAGTVKVSSVQPNGFAVSNNSLFFSGSTSSFGAELWKTDGTSNGTILVKDINAGSGSSSPAYLTDVNGTLFFQAADLEHGNELWKSDGTIAGTQLVDDITPGTAGSTFYNFTTAGGKLFFLDNNNIWESDGTSEGTGYIEDETLQDLSKAYLIGNGNLLYFNGTNNKYGSELYAGDATQIVLPVSLFSFTASLKNTDVVTYWQTASEVNTSYFNIQRSTDGIHFTNAGKVMANGSSNTMQSYSFPDLNIANLVSAKTIYYRLQMVDKNGSNSLSKVVPVSLNGQEAIVLLHPNPAKDVVKIQVKNFSGKITIDLYDLSGKKLRTNQQTVQSDTEIRISVSSLQTGVYIVKTNLNGKLIQQKFVKE